jgi:hypothetical protein
VLWYFVLTCVSPFFMVEIVILACWPPVPPRDRCRGDASIVTRPPRTQSREIWYGRHSQCRKRFFRSQRVYWLHRARHRNRDRHVQFRFVPRWPFQQLRAEPNVGVPRARSVLLVRDPARAICSDHRNRHAPNRQHDFANRERSRLTLGPGPALMG